MILIIGSGVVGFVQSSEIPSDETLVQWEMFKAKYGSNWTVMWHDDRDSPRALYGLYNRGKGTLKTEDEAEQIAFEFVRSNSELFKLNTGDLKVKRVMRDTKIGIFVVEYQQYYRGIPIYRGEVGITLSNNSVISSVGNNFYPGINISTRPKITKEEAFEIAEKLDNESMTANVTSKTLDNTVLYIVPKTENGDINYYLTWYVPTFTTFYFINAEDGAVVHEVPTSVPAGMNGIISTKKKMEIPQGMGEEWEGFEERYGDAFTSVQWDRTCNCVRRIYGYYDTGRSELKSEADAKALARDFLSENAGLFKIDMTQLRFKRVDDWMVDYDQYYNSIPVYDGKVRVRMNSKGVLKAVKNNFHPGINISTRPKMGKIKALWILKRISNERFIEIASDMPLIIKYTELYIVPKTEDGIVNYHLTWQVPTRNAIYFIDAEDGSLVNKVLSAVPSGGGTVSSDGIARAVSSLKYAVGVILLLTLIIIWRLKK